MKKPQNNKQQQLQSARTLHTPVLPPSPEKIRSLVDAAIAAHGGTGHMNLDMWRDVEQELKRKLESEKNRP
jgi:hypothetical protein